jgi:phosphomannomutase
MSMLMLSVSGCRGVVGETLTPEVAARFAGAFGSVLRERAKPGVVPTVVLARDGRHGGETIHAAATAGLLGSGCDVVDIGVAMTPTAAVMTDAVARERSARGGAGGALVAGMVITASHNPQQWNGLKCLLREPAGLHGAGACAPPAAMANEIITRFKGVGTGGSAGGLGVTWERLGRLSRDAEARETHIERVMQALEASGLCAMPSKLGEGLKVAVDCVNASSSATAPMFLRSLGCEVVALNTELEGERAGLFPHAPEPTLENLSGAGGLCDSVRAQGCQVGFALDPDADRLALIDEQGRYVGEEYTLALSAWAILAAARGAGSGERGPAGGEQMVMVTNLSTSRMLNDVAATFGTRVMRTPVGEANVVEVMKREGAIAGGEGNGGTIWPRSCYVRDSLGAMALTLWLLRHAHETELGKGLGVPGAKGHALSQVAACVPSYSIEKRKVDLACKEDATEAVAKIAAFYRGAAGGGQEVDLRDGAWVNFTSGQLANRAWLHVRASNTEPIMRLIAEAPSVAEAKRVLDEAGRVTG